jgi:hypothetical protein
MMALATTHKNDNGATLCGAPLPRINTPRAYTEYWGKGNQVSTEAFDRSRPEGVCANCFATWRARRPRPPALYCWHYGVVARPRSDGWELLEDVSDGELAGMRAEGLL